MNKFYLGLGLMVALLLPGLASATLSSRLGGAAAYDDMLDITWLTDADLSGSGSWSDQLSWVSGLNTANYLGFSDWRLASMSVAAGVPTGTSTYVTNCSSAGEAACRDNELGYMFYHYLGGNLFDDRTGEQAVGDVILTDIQPIYWSGTEYESDFAWEFYLFGGLQGISSKDTELHGWAVRSGDVSVVPIPAAVWFFASGLIVLVRFARQQH